MAAPPLPDRRPLVTGIPPGMADAVLAILGRDPVPIRRRKLLEELERTGHRISLAGLNRVLQYCHECGLTAEGPEGVQLRKGPS